MSEKKKFKYFTNNDVIKFVGEINSGEVVTEQENYMTINKLIDRFIVKIQKGQVQIVDDTKEDDKAPQMPLVDYDDDLIDLQSKIDFAESEKIENNLNKIVVETAEEKKQSDDDDKVETKIEEKK